MVTGFSVTDVCVVFYYIWLVYIHIVLQCTYENVCGYACVRVCMGVFVSYYEYVYIVEYSRVVYPTENKCFFNLEHTDRLNGQKWDKWNAFATCCMCICARFVLVYNKYMCVLHSCIQFNKFRSIARCHIHIVNILWLPCEQKHHNTLSQAFGMLNVLKNNNDIRCG